MKYESFLCTGSARAFWLLFATSSACEAFDPPRVLAPSNVSRSPQISKTETNEVLTAMQAVDFAGFEKISDTQIQRYSNDPAGVQKLKSDLSLFLLNGQNLGIFSKTAEFQEQWQRNLEKFTSTAAIGMMKEISIAQLGNTIFASAQVDLAEAIDARDPKNAELRKKGLATQGDEYFAKTLNQSSLRQRTILSMATGAGLLVANRVLSKAYDIGVLGFGLQMFNSLLEPLIRPIRQKIDQIANQRMAPRLVGWTKFWTGEYWRQRKALKTASSGGGPTPHTDRYFHPGISTPDSVKDLDSFYTEGFRADAELKGYMPGEQAAARDLMMNVNYHQYRGLGEQIDGHETTIATLQLLQDKFVEELKREGAIRFEIHELVDLIKRQKDILVYDNIHSVEAKALEKPIVEILEKWKAKGVNLETIEKFYLGELKIILAKNRIVFSLISFLDHERYFQEYNKALKNLPKTQAGQEASRQMSGVYDNLVEHREDIERWYLNKRGIKYDLMARVDEQGYALGGPMRPKEIPPVRNCVSSWIEAARAAKRAPSGLLK